MILILDIGKTNKKCFVFDEDYRIVFERSAVLPEAVDDDGEPCEDLELLQFWVMQSVIEVLDDPRFSISAINCTTYGASLVHLNAAGQPAAPLYNYLKMMPEALQHRFFDTYGDPARLALETASPVLGLLNSGLQLYWLKHHKPQVFSQITTSFHLPQYIASLWSGRRCSELTSIGCHTMLWHFQRQDYHDWVKAEGLVGKFPPIDPATSTMYMVVPGGDDDTFHSFFAGTGLHDSSAALIPYLACFKEPFVLISTGTWCISLNPFNDEPLTAAELEQDCLCYLTYTGKPVKAARYFGGHEHEQFVGQLADELGLATDFYKKTGPESLHSSDPAIARYVAFMQQLVEKQVVSTRLAIGQTTLRHIYVDGGFSNNALYMALLAAALPGYQVFAAAVAQATALGAALAIHECWNSKPVSEQLITLRPAI